MYYLLMIKGILLDIDGTLLYSNHLHAKAWRDAFEKYGYDISIEKIQPLIGMGGDKIIPLLSKNLTADKGVGEKISKERKEIFNNTYAKDLKPTPGARQLVEFFQKNNTQVIIASSTTNEELSLLLKAAKVDDLIQNFTTSDDVENSKPDRDIVRTALEKLQIKNTEALIIGDTPYDIEAAAKCGVRCIAVRTGGFSDTELTRAFAIFDSPKEIIEKHGELILSL